MKKILLFFIIVLAISCKNESKKNKNKEAIIEEKKREFSSRIRKSFRKTWRHHYLEKSANTIF